MDDVSGFERFCAAAYPELVAALTHHVGHRWLAEELAQEALIRAGDRWASVSKLASPIGWTFRVGANIGNSYFRRRSAEQRALARLGSDAPSPPPDTHDEVGVRQALQTLPVKQREVIVLRYYLGMTPDETATTLGTTSGAVRALSHRAMRRLRELLVLNQREESRDVSGS
ncbi:MAG TPA: sigma-70 family RNA polymerase sigma factor [Jiangellaceae bacterium]